MPYREAAIYVIASLHFSDPGDTVGGGQIVLGADNQLRLVPSSALRRSLEALSHGVAENSLKWGTSLVVGMAALGAGLFLRGKRGRAFGLFAVSGLSGAGAYALRSYARSLEPWLLGPLPLASVQITNDTADRAIRIVLNGGGLKKLVVSIGMNEYDPEEADTFLLALSRARTAEEA